MYVTKSADFIRPLNIRGSVTQVVRHDVFFHPPFSLPHCFYIGRTTLSWTLPHGMADSQPPQVLTSPESCQLPRRPEKTLASFPHNSASSADVEIFGNWASLPGISAIHFFADMDVDCDGVVSGSTPRFPIVSRDVFFPGWVLGMLECADLKLHTQQLKY
jgi:hypothetical protein